MGQVRYGQRFQRCMLSKPVGIPPEGSSIENHRGYIGTLDRKVIVIWPIRNSILGIIDVAQVLKADHGGCDQLIEIGGDRW